MVYTFDQNEFTLSELLKYLIAAFGCQLNGNCFSNQLLHRWIALKKIPELYGGHNIVAVNKYIPLGNLIVLTIDGLDREDVQFLFDHKEMRKDVFQLKAAKQRREIKRRTKLYYKIARQKIPNYF